MTETGCVAGGGEGLARSKSQAYSDIASLPLRIPARSDTGVQSLPMVPCTGTNTPVTFVIELWSIGVESRAVGAFSSRVGKDGCAAMKAFSTAIFFLSLLSSGAFAQSTNFQQVGPLAYEHFNHSAEQASFRLGVLVYYQPMVADACTSQTTVPLIGPVIGHVGTSSTPPCLWSYFPSYGSAATSLGSVPFAYRSFDHGTRCSGGASEASQIASCMRVLGLDRPALNRFESVVVHVMQHYGSQEAVRVNRECVRSLSCSSLYEKSVVDRNGSEAAELVSWIADANANLRALS
jgi:hypothetical protein